MPIYPEKERKGKLSMKRIVALTVMCVLVLSMSVSAAARMNLTGAYLLSLEDGSKLRGSQLPPGVKRTRTSYWMVPFSV